MLHHAVRLAEYHEVPFEVERLAEPPDAAGALEVRVAENVGLKSYRQSLKATHHRRFTPCQLVGRFDEFQTWKSLEQSRECDFSLQAGNLVA